MGPPTRRAVGAATVILASVLSAFGTRGWQKEIPETAVSFRVKGDPQAPVTIVEFSDFECPACQHAEGPLRKMLEFYKPGQVRLVFKNFPLDRPHPWARAAASA